MNKSKKIMLLLLFTFIVWPGAANILSGQLAALGR